MQVVQPIRNLDKLEDILEYLKDQSDRNYLLLYFGISTGLRISDYIALRKKDVLQTHLQIKEGKTGKFKRILIHHKLRKFLKVYTMNLNDDDYLFPSYKTKTKPVRRETVYKILREAGEANNVMNVGCHSARKTFGYHFYKETGDIATLMNLFNHSKEVITLRYIGIDQDRKDMAVRKLKFL